MSADEAEFEQLVAQVIKDGREHIAYEQDVVWPRVMETLTPREMIKLREQMAARKKSAPTRPHPFTPPTPGALKTVGAAAAMVDRARDAMAGRGRSDTGRG